MKNNEDVEFYRLGKLFIDYLSDNVSDIFSCFIDDVKSSFDIVAIKDKYINAYTILFHR